MKLRARLALALALACAVVAAVALTESARTLEHAARVEVESADARWFCTAPQIALRRINARLQRPTIIRTTEDGP